MKNSYYNPRMSAVVGIGKKGSAAHFEVETHPSGKQRVKRWTMTGKPVLRTYAEQVRLVDGDDGNLYIAEFPGERYSFISIMLSNMKHQHEIIYSDDPDYPKVRKLFD